MTMLSGASRVVEMIVAWPSSSCAPNDIALTSRKSGFHRLAVPKPKGGCEHVVTHPILESHEASPEPQRPAANSNSLEVAVIAILDSCNAFEASLGPPSGSR